MVVPQKVLLFKRKSPLPFCDDRGDSHFQAAGALVAISLPLKNLHLSKLYIMSR